MDILHRSRSCEVCIYNKVSSSTPEVLIISHPASEAGSTMTTADLCIKQLVSG